MGNILTGIRVAARLKSVNWQHTNNEELFQCLDWSIDEAYGHITPDEILEEAKKLKAEPKVESKNELKADPKEKAKKTPTTSQRKEEPAESKESITQLTEIYKELEREVKINEEKRIAANERLSERLSTLERKLGIRYQIPEGIYEAYGVPLAVISSSSSNSESEEHKEQTKKAIKNKRKRTESQSKGVHGQSPSKKQHKDSLQ